MRKFSVLFVLLLSFRLFASEKISMAVYDFDARSVPPAIGDSVTDFVQTSLYETGKFNMMDRKNVQKILKEQMFQKTGCSSTDCAVEAGRILNVSNMVLGSVSKLGQRYVISLQLVDVEQGKISISDKVETDSEDMLNVASSALAEHFAKQVGIKGKVLKVFNENEIIINLGSQDKLDKDQELNIERLGEAVKDDSGKVVYQMKESIAKAKPVEINEQGTRCEIVSKTSIVKTGDIVEIKGESARPLSPILKENRQYTQPQEQIQYPEIKARKQALYQAPPESEAGLLALGMNFDSQTKLSAVLKDTAGKTTYTGSLGYVGPDTSYEILGGGPLSWFADIEGGGGIRLITLMNTSQVEFTNYSVFLMPLRFGFRFYPLTPVFNPDYAKQKKVDDQRGAFAPYVSLGGSLYWGFADIDTTDKYSYTQIVFGLGFDTRFGIELFNVLYAEYLIHLASSASVDWTMHNSGGTKTGTGTYTFDLNSSGLGFGIRARF